MERILLTTDLSPTADRALAPTLALAKALGASVTLLHVVAWLPAAPHGAPLAPPVEDPAVAGKAAEAKKALEQLAAGITSQRVDAEVICATEVARGITEYAIEHGFDMIAMATHGRTGVRHLVLGSVAEEVLRRARVPVVCYPPAEGES